MNLKIQHNLLGITRSNYSFNYLIRMCKPNTALKLKDFPSDDDGT